MQDRLGMNDNVKKFPLEQNESGDFLPGHTNEDIDEAGQMAQLAITECDKHGHLWDPKTGDCIEEGCNANYYKYQKGWKDPRKMSEEQLREYYYDKKMEHRYEMMPLLAVLFLVGLVMVAIALMFNL